MEGDDQKRFCAGCSCFVHNLSAMEAKEAESVLSNPERVCARVTMDVNQGILTKDGWIPRFLLAGAIAATVSGCSTPQEFVGESTGKAVVPVKSKPPAELSGTTTGKIAQPNVVMGDIAPPEQRLGEIITPVRSKSKLK